MGRTSAATEIFKKALDSGEIQQLIDKGYRINDLVDKFNVSSNFIRTQSREGRISFPIDRKGYKNEGTEYRTWSDAKFLAICKPWS